MLSYLGLDGCQMPSTAEDALDGVRHTEGYYIGVSLSPTIPQKPLYPFPILLGLLH